MEIGSNPLLIPTYLEDFMQTYGVYFANSLRLWCFLYLPIGPEETEICLPKKMIMELKDRKLESLTDVVPLAHNMAKNRWQFNLQGDRPHQS